MVDDASRLTRSVQDGVVVVSPIGEFDLQLSDELHDALEAAGETSAAVLVDLSRTTFLDSSCIGALVRAGRTVVASGGALRLAAPRANVRRVLELTEVGDYLGVYDNVDEAVAAFQSSEG